MYGLFSATFDRSLENWEEGVLTYDRYLLERTDISDLLYLSPGIEVPGEESGVQCQATHHALETGARSSRPAYLPVHGPHPHVEM